MKKCLTFKELDNSNALFIYHKKLDIKGQSIKDGIQEAPIEFITPGDNDGIIIHTIDSTMFGDIEWSFTIKKKDINKSIIELADFYLSTDRELLLDIKKNDRSK